MDCFEKKKEGMEDTMKRMENYKMEEMKIGGGLRCLGGGIEVFGSGEE